MVSLPSDLDRARAVIAVAMTLLAVGLVAVQTPTLAELLWFAALTAYFWIGVWTPLRDRIPAYSGWGGLLILAWAAYRYTVVGINFETVLFVAVGTVILLEAVSRLRSRDRSRGL